ncbi:hypothetical protein [Bosea sp. TND4EK4]|uniref:hypothetical protein n=1 Tax=Bosea sp. TND4EK4 TaxID=1907408 RepID=UPI000954352D|nr:hypothetical protein [Bosea sp. TND4EK4]SIR48642.1 hypothetical protein SAMN05880592_12421 [Bosea sp. TND4EK4]
MTNNNQDRSITPMATGEEGGGDHPLGPIRDPLADATEGLGNDPSLGELIAVRDHAPDLKIVAREAKRCNDEAQRLPYGLEQTNEDRMAQVGLQIVGLSCAAIVAIWPTDTVEDADAKRALARETQPHYGETDFEVAPMLSVEDAIRIRLHRAAFDVGALVVPPGPAVPAHSDRGLATWPLSRFDLVDAVPLTGGLATLDARGIARWGAFVEAYPDLTALVHRFSTMITIADRLTVIANRNERDSAPMRRAVEGARILGYLAAARAAIWPAMLHSADAQAKLRLVALINDRACRHDPLHQQAAIRHLVSEANWIAKRFRFGGTLELEPSWIPIA